MTNSASDNLLSRLSEFVAARIGLHFPRERWYDLDSAAHEFGFEDAESCIRWIVSSPLSQSQIDILANYLTVGETYFFRNEKLFNTLERQILPKLVRSRRETGRRLRIWSAGCSTGEEPYSIAILLNRIIADLEHWHTTILATDINRRSLGKAAKGVYGKWSFRSAPMMMYFSQERRDRIVQQFYRSLADDGWLITAPYEVQALSFHFVRADLPEAIFHKKDQQRTRSTDDSQTTIAVLGSQTEVSLPSKLGYPKKLPPAPLI